MRVKVSDYIADLVAELGIEQVFTITGGGAMHLNDALGHSSKLSCLYNHHEQACAMAAESYARIKGKPALLCVTSGPGGTNAITGVLGAYLDSVPMLVLSGQVRFDTTVRSTGLNLRALGDQEFDITKAVASMTKYCEMVTDPLMIKYAVKKAYHMTTTGRRGPCWLDIPLNIQGAYVELEDLQDYNADSEEYKEYEKTLPPKVTDELVEEIFEHIKKAKRPVFNVGNGIRLSGGEEVFQRVKQKLNIPVVTGWNSIDLCGDDEDLYVGRAGIMGDRAGNFAVQNSDLLLSIGSRLSIRQVGYNYKTWAREAFTIVEDVDSEELKKPTVRVDMPVWADAKDLLEKMEEYLDKYLNNTGIGIGETDNESLNKDNVFIKNSDWHKICQNWKKDYPVVLPRHYEWKQGEGANVYSFIKELSSRLNENQITVVGNGSACVVGSHGYVIKPGQRFIINSAVASMGYDLPAAIGAWVADTDTISMEFRDNYLNENITKHHENNSRFQISKNSIICVTGDGSIQMNLQELQTIIHHRMNIKIFIINNGGYHSIRQTQRNFFGEPLVGIGEDSCDLSFPDHEKLAMAYGYPYRKIYDDFEQGMKMLDEVLNMDGPVICEVFVTRTQLFEPKSATKKLEDGTLVSAPLEDLAPFLPKEELEKIMIIPMVR